MASRRSSGDDISDSVGLLTSILLCYPEVGTINYEPQKHMLKLNFMLHKMLNEGEWAGFRNEFLECLTAFWQLQEFEPLVVRVDHIDFEGLAVIEVQRDVETLSQEEISLTIGVVKEFFGNDLVAEEDTPALEEDFWGREELVAHLLENVKGAIPTRRLIAFREQGRVLVFNK